MIDRRNPSPSTFRLWFALALLLFGLVLPFLTTMLSPAAPGLAAAALPTAQIRLPTAQQAVVLSARPADVPTALATPAAPQQVATANAAPTADATLPPAPTLTNTPLLLGPVAGAPAAPVPTLFPTQAAPGGAVVPPAAAQAVPLAAPPPILMYHYIRTVDAGSDPLGYNLSVTPEDFDRQMAWLAEQGYHGVRMDTLTRCLGGEVACPANPVAITFDDGYEDAWSTALPILQRYGLTATFYIISSAVGQPGYMTWEQIAALRDAGMEIGAHTVNHYDLTSLDAGTASYEIAQSKSDLEARLNIRVASFCYPTGLYNWAIEEQVRAAGFASATTTRWDGDYSDIMALPRRRIAGGTALEGFAAIVAGG
jgi:peptidoglycan/xylan/chitin deacetylase (PgdA/CDA1 family)